MFKAKIEQLELMDGLKKVKSTLGKAKANPYTDYLYMEVVEENQKPYLKLFTSDGTNCSEVLLEITTGIFEVGVAPIIEFERLYGIIITIDDSAELEFTAPGDNEVQITYKGRRKPIQLNCIESKEYIYLPNTTISGKVVTVPIDNLRQGINAASNIITASDYNPLYNCVNITIDQTVMSFQAIDSQYRRIFYYDIACNTQDNLSFFAECNTIKKILSGYATGKDIEIEVTPNEAIFTMGGYTTRLRLMSGTFPNCIQYFPSQVQFAVEVNKHELISALERAKQMTEKDGGIRSVVFTILDTGMIEMNLNSTLGFLYENLIGVIKSNTKQIPRFDIAFSIDGLWSTLKSLSETDINWSFAGTVGVIVPVNAQGYTHKCLVPSVRMVS